MELYGDLACGPASCCGSGGLRPAASPARRDVLSLSEDLPVVSVAVDARARIEAALERVLELQRRGLITLERAELLSGGAPRRA